MVWWKSEQQCDFHDICAKYMKGPVLTNPKCSVLGFFMQINMTLLRCGYAAKDITLLHIPVDKPTLLNQCGTFSIVYPPTVKPSVRLCRLEEDQGQDTQDELENESRWNTYEWMVGLLRGIIKRPTEMKNGNFTCASSITRVGPNFGAWVDDFFSFYRGKNSQAHNV